VSGSFNLIFNGGGVVFSIRDQAYFIGATQKILTAEGFVTAIAIFGFVFSVVTFGAISPADALPSFARQTGQPCGTCHTDYPGLTPYGRLFKLNGYTTGGGKFRTTLFPLQGDPNSALAAYAKKTNEGNNATLSGPPSTSNIWVPPVAMMAVGGYTHTQAPQDNAPYNPNDNFTIPQVSLFYGGAVTEHVGLFSQWTYDGRSAWGWDNQDIRYSNTATLGMLDVIYGFSADNNPTMGDPWNTVPAWGFPYMSSNLAPDPGGGTLVDGGLEQAVAGFGAYGYFNNLVYVQLSGYRSINPETLIRLGAGPSDSGAIDGVAPYWRVAIEPHWGRHWLELGTFGMYARLHPWSDPDTFTQTSQTDRYTDIAFDTQYQYQGDNYWLTLRGTYIHESQSLDATFGVLGAAANPTNTLNSLKLYGSLAYGNDNRFVFSGQYFDTWGSSDTGLYADNPGCACSPNSNGYVAEIAYIPFISSFSPLWPWANERIGLKYTYYNKFAGDTVHAHDNNTLFVYLWFAM
jgi:hypothetical protein